MGMFFEYKFLIQPYKTYSSYPLINKLKGAITMIRKAGVTSCIIVLLLFLTIHISWAATPQITITDAKKSDVMSAIVPEMLSAGFSVKSMNDYTVVFSMYKDNFWASVFTGSNSFELRLICNVVEMGNNTLVTATTQVVSFPGTASEAINPANASTENQIQKMLDRLKFGFDGGYMYGFDYKANKKDWEIAYVYPGGSFADAGIVNGDKLVAINGKLMSDYKKDEFEKIFAENTARFTFKHKNGTTQTYTLTKNYFPPKYKKTIIAPKSQAQPLDTATI